MHAKQRRRSDKGNRTELYTADDRCELRRDKPSSGTCIAAPTDASRSHAKALGRGPPSPPYSLDWHECVHVLVAYVDPKVVAVEEGREIMHPKKIKSIIKTAHSGDEFRVTVTRGSSSGK